MNKRILGGLAAAVMLTGGLALTSAGVASAHHPDVTGSAECQSDGTYTVSWTATSWEQNDMEWKLTAPVALPAGGGFQANNTPFNWTQTGVDGQDKSVETSATAVWNNEATGTRGGEVVLDGQCEKEEKKVWVCHATSGKGELKNGYNLIHVDESAVPAHEAHFENNKFFGPLYDIIPAPGGADSKCGGGEEFVPTEVTPAFNFVPPTCEAAGTAGPVDTKGISWSGPTAGVWTATSADPELWTVVGTSTFGPYALDKLSQNDPKCIRPIEPPVLTASFDCVADSASASLTPSSIDKWRTAGPFIEDEENNTFSAKITPNGGFYFPASEAEDGSITLTAEYTETTDCEVTVVAPTLKPPTCSVAGSVVAVATDEYTWSNEGNTYTAAPVEGVRLVGQTVFEMKPLPKLTGDQCEETTTTTTTTTTTPRTPPLPPTPETPAASTPTVVVAAQPPTQAPTTSAPAASPTMPAAGLPATGSNGTGVAVLFALLVTSLGGAALLVARRRNVTS